MLFTPVFEEEEEKKEDKKPEEIVKTFSQEEVNTIIAKEKNKTKAASQKRITDLEKIRDSHNLSENAVDDLNLQIETMESELKTKEELAKEEKTRLEKNHKRELDKISKSNEVWQGRYTNLVIQNAIINSSVENKAFDPEQIVAIIAPSTRLVDTDGILSPKTKFIGLDDENKEIELDIAPKDAIKRMSEMNKYANLFKRESKNGLGGFNVPSKVGTVDYTKTTNWLKERKKMGFGKNRS